MEAAWNDLLDESWLNRLEGTPFLTRCRAGRASRIELHAFVRQQYHYARHFTRYLCALLANLSDEGDRNELAHNLWEEMGFGHFGAVPHAQIYREMMARMGVRPETEGPRRATEELVDAMLDCCRDTDPLVGLGALCLGAEAIVPRLYRQIVQGFEGQGEPSENLEFFRIHIEEDDKHAETMRRIIDKALKANPEYREKLRAGALRVLSARARFFEEIGETHVAV
jgi:pyrroloquinoline quinone (PQQ) biosynthesis protein C